MDSANSLSMTIDAKSTFCIAPSVGTWLILLNRADRRSIRPLGVAGHLRILGSPSNPMDFSHAKGCNLARPIPVVGDLVDDNASSVPSTTSKSNRRRDARKHAMTSFKAPVISHKEHPVDCVVDFIDAPVAIPRNEQAVIQTQVPDPVETSQDVPQGFSLSMEQVGEIIQACRPVLMNIMDNAITPLADAIRKLTSLSDQTREDLMELTLSSEVTCTRMQKLKEQRDKSRLKVRALKNRLRSLCAEKGCSDSDLANDSDGSSGSPMSDRSSNLGNESEGSETSMRSQDDECALCRDGYFCYGAMVFQCKQIFE